MEKLLTAEEERSLILRIKQGRREDGTFDEDATIAKRELLESNYALVGRIAKSFAGRGISYDDLFQDGCCGLIAAVDSFDLNRNTRFSTYATYWIRHEIFTSFRHAFYLIHIPSTTVSLVKRWEDSKKALAVGNYEPTHAEVDEHAGLSRRQAIRVQQALCAMTLASEWTDTIDPRCNEDRMRIDEMLRKTTKAMDDLPAVQRDVINHRYAADAKDVKTYRQVGKILNRCHEWVRAKEIQALAKLQEMIKI